MIYAHEEREKKTKYVGPRPGYPEQCELYWSLMGAYLTARNLSFPVAKLSGWYPTFYQGSPRIVIPCSNSAGVPYFQARSMRERAKLRYASPPAPRDDSLAVVWPGAKAKGTVVVEGPMDALAAAEEGYLGIGLMGNQPTQDVLEHLCSIARTFQPALVIPDVDALSFGPTVLVALAQAGITGMVIAPPRKDLAAMTVKQRKALLVWH